MEGEIIFNIDVMLAKRKMSVTELSEKVGKNRSTVTNYLRLLKLPAEVQVALSANRISMAHARAIINIEDADTQLMILHEIIQKDLSVRQVETMVKTIVEPKKAVAKSKSDLPQLHQDTKKELHDYIQSEVEIKSRKGKGTITITFNSDSDFQRIISLIKK